MLSVAMESMNGMMEGSMKEPGSIIRWMAMVFLLGLTAENILYLYKSFNINYHIL
jgi:hypothetical protein